MWSSCQRNSGTQLGQSVSDIKRDMTKVNTVVFTQTGAAYDENTEETFKQTWMHWVEGQKYQTFWETRTPFPPLHLQKSMQQVCAGAADDSTICSKIVPCHRNSPNTRNSARFWSLSPIMAPDEHSMATNLNFLVQWNFSFKETRRPGETAYYRDNYSVIFYPGYCY